LSYPLSLQRIGRLVTFDGRGLKYYLMQKAVQLLYDCAAYGADGDLNLKAFWRLKMALRCKRAESMSEPPNRGQCKPDDELTK